MSLFTPTTSSHPSPSMVTSSNHAIKVSLESKSAKTLTNGELNVVGGRIRQRLVSLSWPATGPMRWLGGRPPPGTFIESSRHEIHPSNPETPPKSISFIQLQSHCPTSSRGHWDVLTPPENQTLWNEFSKLCMISTLSLPYLSATSPSTRAHIALCNFTTLQKLRAVLLGSSRRTSCIGEVYISPLIPIEQFNRKSASGSLDVKGAEVDDTVFSNVSQDLEQEFATMSQVMGNFIFPIRLIEPFNAAISIINRSQFLRYLLVHWKNSRTISSSQERPTDSAQYDGSCCPELLFLEWYFASSRPSVTSMLNKFVSGAGGGQVLSISDIYEDTKPTAANVRQNILSKELETLASVRRVINVAIDKLFWHRIEMMRAPIGKTALNGDVQTSESKSWKKEMKGNMCREIEKTGRKRDAIDLRREIAIRLQLTYD